MKQAFSMLAVMLLALKLLRRATYTKIFQHLLFCGTLYALSLPFVSTGRAHRLDLFGIHRCGLSPFALEEYPPAQF